MSKQFFTIKSFQGGINSKDHPRDMHEMQSQDIQGLTVKDSGEAKSPGGYDPTQIKLSAATSSTLATTPGYGLYAFQSDNGLDGNANITNLIAYPFIDDGIGNGEDVLKIWESTDNTDRAGLNLDNGTNAITKPNLVYYYKNGALRVADSNLHANAVPHKFIFNKRQQMTMTEANSTAWLWVSTAIEPPGTVSDADNATGDVEFTNGEASLVVPGGAVTTGMYAADRINIDHEINTDITTSLAAGTYEFAASWIYDSGQESVPTPSSGSDISINNTNGIYFRAYYKSRASGSVNVEDFGAHIIGSRLYVRRQEDTGDSWHFLLDVDFARGSRDSMFDAFRGTGVVIDEATDGGSLSNREIASGDDQAATTFYTDVVSGIAGDHSTFYVLRRMNPMTYESINGYRPDVDSVGMAKGHGFKDSAVIGTRVFLANVSYKDEHGTTKAMGDRILYSMPNKFDTFPNTNFLDIGADDGESFTAIEGFGGMLFSFKSTNMYIVNVQSGSPAGWGVVGKYDFMGIKFPSAYTKTEFGIVWANEFGCYMSNGQGVQKLTNSIGDTTWNSFIHDSNPALVSYDPIEKSIMVQGNSSSSDDLYVFNMSTKSWTRQINNLVIAGSDNHQTNTNTALHNGVPITASFNDNDDKMYIWQWATTAASQAFVIHTKDFDLGQPQLKKKIYSVIITLNNNNADITLWKVYVGVDGAAPSAQSGFSNSTTISSNADWIVQKETFTTPLTGESFSFKFSGTGNVRIGDISIEHRPLRKRAD